MSGAAESIQLSIPKHYSNSEDKLRSIKMRSYTKHCRLPIVPQILAQNKKDAMKI
jgi:hypothetical protein